MLLVAILVGTVALAAACLRTTLSIEARFDEVFLPEIAICRFYGGGGNRTRVTSYPETSGLQADRVSASPDDEPRPPCDSAALELSEPTATSYGGVLRPVGSLKSSTSRTTARVTSAGAGPSPEQEVHHPLVPSQRRGACLMGVGDHPLGAGDVLALVREAGGGEAAVPLDGRAVEGARRDRDARVGLESVPALAVDDRLLVPRLELVRDPAGEPLPDCLAWSARVDGTGASDMAARIHPPALRLADERAELPASSPLVLTAREPW